MSTFYLVQHSFKLGKCADWWKTFASFDEEKLAGWTRAVEELGFYNHCMMGQNTDGADSFCVWEAAEGKTAAEFQEFIDGENGPSFGGCLNNTCFPIALGLAGTSPFPRHFVAATEEKKNESSSSATPSTASSSETFLVRHTFKAGKAGEWWSNFGALASKPEEYAAFMAKHGELGFHNHAFMPTSQTGDAFCIWEAKAGTSPADMQEFIDGPDGPSFGCFSNSVLKVDPAISNIAAIDFKLDVAVSGKAELRLDGDAAAATLEVEPPVSPTAACSA